MILSLDNARTPDDLLTALHGIAPQYRETALLSRRGVAWDRLLRAAADLCGVDSEGMGRRDAALAIMTNF
jgi:hypothetical protein